jgi:hypothetical protein
MGGHTGGQTGGHTGGQIGGGGSCGREFTSTGAVGGLLGSMPGGIGPNGGRPASISIGAGSAV